MDGLAAVCRLAAARFDAAGRIDQAISHMDFALAMAQGLADAVLLLQSMKAPFLVAVGQVAAAGEALARAEESLARARSPRSAMEYVAIRAAVRCMRLDFAVTRAVTEDIGRLGQAGEHAQASFVMGWLVPLMFAQGEKEAAEPWRQALRVHAEELDHPYRLADVLSFEFAARAGWGPAEVEEPPPGHIRSSNPLASYRVHALQLRLHLLRADWPSAEAALMQIALDGGKIGASAAAMIGGYRAIAAAHRTPNELPRIGDPPPASLITLGGLFAAAEAVAIAGTQRDAVKWLHWIEHDVPQQVRTALEWPVSRERVVALLRARAGSVREAVRAFRDSIEWAARAGYECEAALAQVQLAEVLSLAEVSSSERARSRLRRSGWMKLQELEIDPTPHAYAATRALAMREDVATRPQLTPRQVGVLSLLAEGMTYREAAERLGTSWRTVSTQAYQTYERLGVSGKFDAVRAARRLQILEPRRGMRLAAGPSPDAQIAPWSRSAVMRPQS